MPIMAWLHYADHALDPIRRSSSGSNVPIADRPSGRRTQSRQRPCCESFQTVAYEWLKKQSVRWTDKHHRSVEGALERHIFPRIGAKPITAIDPADVLDALKTLDETGSHETAHRCHQRITAIFAYAIATQRCRTNPTDGIRGALTPGRPYPDARHRTQGIA